MNHNRYLPEGYRTGNTGTLPLPVIEQYIEEKKIVEGRVLRCDRHHALHVSVLGYEGIMVRPEANSPLLCGSEKEISVLSRVGHTVAFLITGIRRSPNGAVQLILSRRQAQEQALTHLLEHGSVGAVLRGRITHLEPFGAFVDIGCGITALLPLEYISVARINHPKERFYKGQNILCILKQIDVMQNRFTLSHKELLGTWLENAALFAPGETVEGIVRGIKDYGIFVELTPNLSGLAEYREGLAENDNVSVYIKSIRPEQMKIKLQILQKTEPVPIREKLSYFITDGILQRWQYAPAECTKPFPATIFS